MSRGGTANARAAPRLRGLVVLGLSLLAFVSTAAEVTVPLTLQAQLISKVAGYDRRFKARAGASANVLIVVKRGDGDSARVAGQLHRALSQVPEIGDLPHRDKIVEFTSAAQIAHDVRMHRAAIVYLSTGLPIKQLEAIAGALLSLKVLTVGAERRYVGRGVVLSFDLVSSRPKLFVHIEQARLQDVDFTSDVLKLMEVVR